jgi:hypothetical protein
MNYATALMTSHNAVNHAATLKVRAQIVPDHEPCHHTDDVTQH